MTMANKSILQQPSLPREHAGRNDRLTFDPIVQHGGALATGWHAFPLHQSPVTQTADRKIQQEQADD